MSVGYGVFFGNVVLLPLWLQQDMGYTATLAGAVLAPVGLLAILLSPFVGKNISKIDPRLFATVAFTVFALIFWMRSQFTPQADFVTIMIPSLIQGIAMATFFVPLVTLIFSGLAHDRIPAASGLSNFVRIMAGGFGASIFTSAWVNRTSAHHAVLTEHINFANQASQSAIDGLGSTGMSEQQTLDFINDLVNQQAATMAADDMAWLSAVLFILLISLIWLIHPMKQAVDAKEAAGGIDPPLTQPASGRNRHAQSNSLCCRGSRPALTNSSSASRAASVMPCCRPSSSSLATARSNG